jgi:hypothetical protein
VYLSLGLPGFVQTSEFGDTSFPTSLIPLANVASTRHAPSEGLSTLKNAVAPLVPLYVMLQPGARELDEPCVPETVTPLGTDAFAAAKQSSAEAIACGQLVVSLSH